MKIMCGSGCTEKKSGLMEALPCFDTGPMGNQTLKMRSVSPQHSVTQDSGQMIIAHYDSHSSVTKKVMHLIFALLVYITGMQC